MSTNRFGIKSINLPSDEKKSDIVFGFHILQDGTFVSIKQSGIELISKNASKNGIKKISIQPNYYSLHSTSIFEYTNNLLFVLYNRGDDGHYSELVLIDRKKATLTPIDISGKNLELVPYLDHSILVNFEDDYSKKNTFKLLSIEPGLEKDKYNIQIEDYFPIKEIPLQDIPLNSNLFKLFQLSDGSGFIRHTGEIIQLLNNEFKNISFYDLPVYQKDHRSQYSMDNYYYRPSWTRINQIIFLDRYFACLTLSNEGQMYSHCSRSYRQKLYFFTNNLTEINSIELDRREDHVHCSFKLLALSTDHVAIIRRRQELDRLNKEERTEWNKYDDKPHLAVLVYDSKGNLVNELELNPNDFVVSAPNGNIVTCNIQGKITIHQVLPKQATIGLRKENQKIQEIQKCLALPKDLINIITGYAGLFAQQDMSPQNKYTKKVHVDRCKIL